MARRLAKAGVAGFERAEEPVVLDREFQHLLVWYMDLRARTVRGFHTEPIQFSEIEAYGRIYKLDIEAFEVEMLCKVDGIWLDVNRPKDQNKKSTPVRPHRTGTRP